MTLKEYFTNLDRDDVLTALIELYPEQEKNLDGYIMAWNEIVSLTPNRTDGMNIEVYRCIQKWEHCDDDDYIGIHGRNPELKGLDEWGSPRCETTWAIEYTPWDEWLAMDVVVVDKDPRVDSFEKVLAHILWEMTWSGFTQRQVKERADEIFDRAKEVEEAIANGTIGHITTPCENIFKDLGIEDPYEND